MTDEQHLHKKNFFTSKWAFLIYGLLVGVLVILGIRYFTYHPHKVHYHANFGVYINGQQELFKDPTYYEEVALCNTGTMTPQARTHMHDEEAGVVHVHDEAIQDRDRLLISFGDADQTTLDKEYKTVPNNAAEVDKKNDPSSCAGADKVTPSVRLHHLF
jgi:hypothetical protein